MTPPWTVGSPIRAAMRFPISTVGEPIKMTSGGPAALGHVGDTCCWQPANEHSGASWRQDGAADMRDEYRHHRANVHVGNACGWWHGSLISCESNSCTHFLPPLVPSSASSGFSGSCGLEPLPAPAAPPLL